MADRIVVQRPNLISAKIGQLTSRLPISIVSAALRRPTCLATGRGATQYITPQTRSRWRAFIAGEIRFGAIARRVEATIEALDTLRQSRAIDVGGRPLSPLTITRDIKLPPSLPQIALKAS